MISVSVNSVSARGDMHHFTFLAPLLALKHACPGTGQGEPRFGYVTCSGISDNIGTRLHLVIRGFHIMHHINLTNNVYWLLTVPESGEGGSSFSRTLNCLLNCSLKPTQQKHVQIHGCNHLIHNLNFELYIEYPNVILGFQLHFMCNHVTVLKQSEWSQGH